MYFLLDVVCPNMHLDHLSVVGHVRVGMKVSLLFTHAGYNSRQIVHGDDFGRRFVLPM